jgi:hypothetical protein
MSDTNSESNKQLKSVLFSPECVSLVNDYNRHQYNSAVKNHCYSNPDNYSTPECADFFRKNKSYTRGQPTQEMFQTVSEDNVMANIKQKLSNISQEIPEDVRTNARQHIENAKQILEDNVKKFSSKVRETELFHVIPEEEKIKEISKTVANTVETHFILIVVIIIIISCSCLLFR